MSLCDLTLRGLEDKKIRSVERSYPVRFDCQSVTECGLSQDFGLAGQEVTT